MFTLTGKTAFITGGAAGIGLAVGTAFREAGATVVLADLRDGSDVAAAIGATFVQIDVSDEASVAVALQEVSASIGLLDVLVNNAGVGDIGPTLTNTEQGLIEKVTHINYYGVLYGLKHGPSCMRDGGSIINTSSMASFINMPGSAVYSASKRAVNSLGEMAALELGERGIRVNAVCPGYIAAGMASSDEGRVICEAFTALGRVGTLDDLVGAFLFLASDASRYVSGEAIRIDGGWHCGPTPALLKQIIGSESVS